MRAETAVVLADLTREIVRLRSSLEKSLEAFALCCAQVADAHAAEIASAITRSAAEAREDRQKILKAIKDSDETG